MRTRFPALLALTLAFAGCVQPDNAHTIRVSTVDQKMILYRHGIRIATYDVSTSKFGLGDRPGSRATPLGHLEIAKKIGAGQPSGMKFHSRRPTGEIVAANAPGRDPIVSRILWLKGLEPSNRNTFGRTIYIHGTAEEWKIGQPASYGCVRMRSRDVIQLFQTVGVGAQVEIVNAHFPELTVAAATPPGTKVTQN